MLASLCHCHGQGTTTSIGFEGPPDFLAAQVVSNYFESGMAFVANINQQGYGGFARINKWPFSDHAYNSTAYIASLQSLLEITSTSGSLFGLTSVDLAEQTLTSPNAVTVQFIGYLAGGGTVMTSFTTDGIIGVPGTSDFQTFYFGPEFSGGLTRVVIPAVGASLDNLVFSVPEPSTWILGLFGGDLFLLAHRVSRTGKKSCDTTSPSGR